ncbi:hypothetical protein B0T21DRAFT_454810 [Apiosordaria backusii]|uniref:Inner centromere protein ARK-binding domain-containing protein n=1 Tax=Apiosordaria backusii TaxID=314023 RepID=A0AA40DQZ7_9PEZI|nr:hypothetical protein B0T21DRAFT_454810 [Apiosordaria backusii]
MALRGGPRLQVGSAAWVEEERNSALDIAESEIEEFSFSARNELDWLNEHMAEIFSENQMNVAELFKTPGKLRGKTPMTTRKIRPLESRVPLSDVFSSTPKDAPNPFTIAHQHSPARLPQFQVAADKPEPPVSRTASPAKILAPPLAVAVAAPPSLPFTDSGYHGSQTYDTVNLDYCDNDDDVDMVDSPHSDVDAGDFEPIAPSELAEQPSPTLTFAEEGLDSADENEVRQATAYAPANSGLSSEMEHHSSPLLARTKLPMMSPRSPSPKKTASLARSSPIRTSQKSSPQKQASPQKSSSPRKSSPQKLSPAKQATSSLQRGFPKPTENLSSERHEDFEEDGEDAKSPSEASSPIRPTRPLIRKSSLNFPSLPAREPLASKKSLGGTRISRTSHLDFSRPSFYNRHTGGKSLGNTRQYSDDEDNDDMDVDEELTAQLENTTRVAEHNKTYTQLLQDQISMLGKSQATGPRPSKSLANLFVLPVTQAQANPGSTMEAKLPSSPKQSPQKPKESIPTPGAFPEDDDEDWIAAPNNAVTAAPVAAAFSPRPELGKSFSADIMESAAGKSSVGGAEVAIPPSSPASTWKAQTSPQRKNGTPGHSKSASVPAFPTLAQLEGGDGGALKKMVTATHPTLPSVEEDGRMPSPGKSPTRSAFRDNPLKQVKNKLSSLLSSAKGLSVRSAAISAEGKAMISPSTVQLGYHPGPSVESFRSVDNVIYPDLTQQLSATSRPVSPVRSNSTRRTRASTEREKIEAKEREKDFKAKEKEIKETKRAEKELEKLDKARKQEQEKARVFSKEQERIAAMEKQLALQREREQEQARAEQARAAQSQHRPQSQDLQTPAPVRKVLPKALPQSTRTSPRRTKGQADGQGFSDEIDVDMAEATSTVTMAMPPSSIQRPTTASSVRTQGIKRPVKPTKEALSKSTRQAPKVMRVYPPSSQQSQFHPSNSVLASNLQETLSQQQQHPPQKHVKNKASQSSLNEKKSLSNLKASASSAALKRKEQEEREAQRKRDAKAELERKRAAAQEEENHRKRIEKAKLTKAPPPAVRSQPNGPPDYSMADKAPARPPSRLGSTMHQESRLVNQTLVSGKASMKRPLQPENEGLSKSQPQRTLPLYQSQEPKRIRVSEDFDQDIEMADSQQRMMKPPPVRPSAGLKEPPAKPTYSAGYANVPQVSASRDLFKATVVGQHQSTKNGPLDMSKFSKGAIPFAPNRPTGPAGNPHKTPARPGAGGNPKSINKAATRSSPRFQNGEAIELPEIQTDDDDDDEDEHINVADWADSPALKQALLAQERMDPMQVFGPPAPLNMEEVFSKSKDRWHKFRARTSSANWSGTDRLTEDEVRKDNLARDKMRRDGGWSYELSRELSKDTSG